MACCASAGGKNVVVRILFALWVVVVTGPLAAVLWPLSVIPGIGVLRRFCLSMFSSFSEGLREDLKKPLIGGSLHCRLSGRLLHHSPMLSGLVYNYFNLVLVLPILILAFVVWYIL